MIKVVVKKNEIVVTGHSGYEEYGKDIVCAAVSSTVLTTINAILSIDSSSISVTEGEELKIEILKHDNNIDILINNMINMLSELENDYSKYIKVIKEG
jgi:uncharacterized protein YsxB (DUF464 family)